MIPNVNQFTAQLRMMPDQALQRVAMMYKQDPYILPMVIAEDTARKKLRAAAQAQMVQPQMKVADQAVMAMGQQPQAAPGIAALPAPNMQGMADGGIAGYAEGGVSDTAEDAFSRGGMFDFTQRSEPVVRMAYGGAVRYQDRGLVETPPIAQDTALMLTDPELSAEIEAGETEYRRAKREEREAKERLSFLKKAAPDVYEREKARLTPPAKSAKTEEPAAPKKKEARTAADIVRESAPVPAVPAAPAAPVVQAPPAYTAPTPEATASGIEALMAAPKRDTESAYAELRKMYEPEEKELAQRRGQRGAEALLRAGLAMMSGTSPHAAVNIGKGATEGLNAYQEAQRYDDQAARALRQAQITMRMAERQEQIGNRRDAVTLFGQAQQQQQAAVSSAQQAQQIKQSGDYQQGSLAIMQQNANTNAKLVQARINALNLPAQQEQRKMAEYGKIQKQVMSDLSKDVAYMTETDPTKKAQIFNSRMQMAVANNPFLADLLFSGKPTGKVRDLEDTGDEKD
jgi:hypothetical protein